MEYRYRFLTLGIPYMYLGLKVCRHVMAMLLRDWLKLVGGVIIL